MGKYRVMPQDSRVYLQGLAAFNVMRLLWNHEAMERKEN